MEKIYSKNFKIIPPEILILHQFTGTGRKLKFLVTAKASSQDSAFIPFKMLKNFPIFTIFLKEKQGKTYLRNFLR